MEIYKNSIITPDGTVLESKHRWDYVTYKDNNEQFYAIDGGLDYLKRGFDKPDYIENSVTSDSKFEDIRKCFTWTSLTKGKQLLKDLDTEHIKAIIRTQEHISDTTKNIFLKELEYRKGK